MPIPSRGRLATDAGEVLLAVAVCTLAVAALDPIAATAGLTVLYLLGVMVVAVRRGTGAALATAVLAVLALNFFFIAPIHRLTIRDSGNVVALLVFLVVAVVVARLAADARARAQEAGERAAEAAARREEAELVAAVAALLLGAGGVESRLPELGGRIAGALGVREAHVEVAAAPTSMPGLRAVSLPIDRLRVWLHLPTDAAPGAADLDRVLASLAAVIDVALERDALTAAADAADAARRADVAKTAVLHAISHDLRSPLTAITTAAEAMAGAGLRPEDHADLLGVIRGESDRLAGLVDDLLDLSRIQAHAVNPQLDWCDLRDVAASAAAHVRLTPVALEIPDDLPLVRADDAQMERVLANLLDNAARFSPPGQPVRVTGGVGGGWVTVRVIDAGPGVPLGQRSAVFEPFYRGRGARTSTGGAGLGLAICKGFVEANGGRIRLAPDSATGGTAVSVSLPLVEQPAAHA